MVSPDGEPVDLRPAFRTMVIAVVDGIFLILLLLAWLQWPYLWYIWLVSILLCIPLNMVINPICRMIPLNNEQSN